jgi:hypothetical protein
MKKDVDKVRKFLNHTVIYWNYMNYEEVKTTLFENFTTISPIYISDSDTEFIVFENNTFDSNVGIHGGAIHINHQK